VGRFPAGVLVLVLAIPAAADSTDDGIDAAARGDWATACECFAKAENDSRSPSRLAAGRAQAVALLGPAIEDLVKKKRWAQVAEVAACGLSFDATNYRYTGAATRATREGATVPAEVDGRIRAWATYGLPYGYAETLRAACVEALLKSQEPEGHWDCEKHGGQPLYAPGVTALALLALGTGHREAADRAAQALWRTQNRDGVFGGTQSVHWIYNHAIATRAVAEHAVRCGRPAEDPETLQRAVDVIASAQTKGAGWRYDPGAGESDTSITARCVAALRAAERAGATVDAACFEGASKFVGSMTDPEFGQIGYNFPGGTPARPEGLQDAFPPERTQSMTAAGSVAMLLVGADPQRLAKGFGLIAGCLPSAKHPDFYYWESAAEAWMLQQGRIPQPWYEALVKAAAAQRDEKGGVRASDPWGRDGGRVYASALVALALEAPRTPRPSRLPTASEFRKAGRRTILFPGGADPLPTGIYVEAGMVLSIAGKGVISTYEKSPGQTPAGSKEKPAGRAKARDRSAPYGCLLGAIDDGKLFAIQVGKQNTMRGFGHLWLLVNDDDPSDNVGSWEVEVEFVR